MNIYVGNLAYTASEDDIKEAFEEHGKVESVRIITDRATGRSKGFAFVTMTDDGEGRTALENMNGAEIRGRKIRADEARPRREF